MTGKVVGGREREAQSGAAGREWRSGMPGRELRPGPTSYQRHAALQHRQQHADLPYLLVVRGERRNGGVGDVSHRLHLVGWQGGETLGGQGRTLALFAGEGEDDGEAGVRGAEV